MSTADTASPAQVTLRRAQPGDEQRLSLLGSATFLESYARLLPAGDILAHAAKQHAPERYAGWLADPESACWLAEQQPGCAPVAYAVLTRPNLPLADSGADDLEILRIYVLHPYQGAGLGVLLMRAIDEHARTKGAARLLLGVYSRNVAALAFYERQGFTRAGTRHFRVGEHDYFDYILQRIL